MSVTFSPPPHTHKGGYGSWIGLGSLIALSIHALGCLTTVIYQSVFLAQPLWVILCYIVGFISETSIVLMCLYYKRKKKQVADTLSKRILDN